MVVPAGQGLPCRLPRCLFLAYINRRGSTLVASRRRRCRRGRRGRRRRPATNTESLWNRTPRVLASLHTRAFLAGLRKTRHYPCEIETPPRFPPRVVLRKRALQGAWEGRALAGEGEGWVMVVTHSRQRRKDATSWVGRTNEVFLIDDSANYYCCYCYKGSAYLVFGLEFFSGNFRDTWRSVFFSREWFLSRSDCYLVCRSLGTTASRIFCNSFRDEDELVINRNTLTKEEDGGDKRN